MKLFLFMALSIGLLTTSSINAGLFASRDANTAQEPTFIRGDSLNQDGYAIWYGYNEGADDLDEITGYACPPESNKATVIFTYKKPSRYKYTLYIAGTTDGFFASITLNGDHRIVEFNVQKAPDGKLFQILLPANYNDASVKMAITNHKLPYADILKILLKQETISRLIDYTNSILQKD